MRHSEWNVEMRTSRIPYALKRHVADFPDQTLGERAGHFQVSKSSVWYGLRKLGCTRKKS
ncbi:hypothetical protein C6503_17440 [Candidatus Poribacteria bacterium]|nr:MAG: hypothetical protein C6503_17440 [Candidatus Poribacteria bacterium]